MRYSCEEQHEAAFQFAKAIAGNRNRLNRRRAIRVESNKVHTAESCSILVLLSDRFCQNVARNMERPLGQFIFRHGEIKISTQRLQYTDANAGRGSQARTCNDL